MVTLNPILTATPGNPLSYNVGIAETFSWIPVENNADRPLFARASYNVNPSDTSISFNDTSSLDAFGRLRVSQPSTLFDSKQLYGKAPQYYDEAINGTASIAFAQYDSCTVLQTSASGDYAINQSRVRFNYQPGKSLKFMFTGLFKPETNVIKRVGCFQSLSAAPYTPSDGLWLEVTENGPIFRSEKTQGTAHTQFIPQSSWNVDKMDGTGPSGHVLNLSATNLFCIDYEWLGVGRVRYGFFVNGRLEYCHVDDHKDDVLQAPYMTYSNQPVRYEIRQTGAGSGTLKQICSTVLTEGGEDDVGSLVTAAVSGTGITVTSTADTWTPILAVRSTPGFANIVSTIKSIEVLNNTSRNLIYQLVLNPTITPALNWQTIDYGMLQQALGGNGFTLTSLGYNMLTNYVTPAGKGALTQSDIARALGRMGTSISGNPDTLVLIGRFLDNTGSNANIHAAMNILIRG